MTLFPKLRSFIAAIVRKERAGETEAAGMEAPDAGDGHTITLCMVFEDEARRWG